MHSLLPRFATVSALAVVAVGGTATVAEAYRGPTKKERAAITRAVKNSKLTAGVPDRSIKLTRVHVSLKGPYASARVSAPGASAARAVLRRSSGKWKLLTVGTAGIGCRVPAAAREDLELPCS